MIARERSRASERERSRASEREREPEVRGSGIVVVFGGVDSLSGLPFDDVTLACITPVGYPNKVYFSLPNTGETSPGGLGYNTAAVFEDMLLVYGGLRKMRYDSSNQL